ncbi:hypothetical protein AVEN_63742-1 [Araneus ventricosus]|uniref:Uncharacterized protein n=1 Tax=Araneus ventricosus TaxID=182803 RepID=A0A4Y2P3N3_ARAVE|nr:hypothetical protein AVEN_63742-1 [Araneus ventricosus]
MQKKIDLLPNRGNSGIYHTSGFQAHARTSVRISKMSGFTSVSAATRDKFRYNLENLMYSKKADAILPMKENLSFASILVEKVDKPPYPDHSSN